jgi:hypothetical protein
MIFAHLSKESRNYKKRLPGGNNSQRHNLNSKINKYFNNNCFRH